MHHSFSSDRIAQKSGVENCHHYLRTLLEIWSPAAEDSRETQFHMFILL